MDDTNKRIISICNNGHTKKFRSTNGEVSKSALADHFGQGRLIYIIDDEPFILASDEANFFLEEDIDEYHFEPSNGSLASRKFLRFEEMREKLLLRPDGKKAGKRSCSTDDRVMNERQQTEDVSINHQNGILGSDRSRPNAAQGCRRPPTQAARNASKPKVNLPYLKRILYVRCMVKEHFDASFVPQGRGTSFELDGNHDYPIEEIKDMCKEALLADGSICDEDVARGESIVMLGLLSGKSFDEFVDESGKPCTLWEFCKCPGYRNGHSEMRMSLLITKIALPPGYSNEKNCTTRPSTSDEQPPLKREMSLGNEPILIEDDSDLSYPDFDGRQTQPPSPPRDDDDDDEVLRSAEATLLRVKKLINLRKPQVDELSASSCSAQEDKLLSLRRRGV
ncbi:hypothetical protein QAD02_007555 [Eretmocerus hayati]|uniref:Uncharacterized protein n=1 Tax=Eretmocerus hayati TaxID=131215 RepID=A0ACC2N4M1_9HYME|nr:hypothetical protein QAD02_007555 [Eretmocerus hayati]